jgi:lipopolysaccharide biosynthesis glycosyltransferase
LSDSHRADLGTAPDPISVVLGVDAAYVPWAATLILSCLEANPGQAVDFYILNDGSVGEVERARLQVLVSEGPSTISFIDIDGGLLASLPSTPQFGPIVWLRFHIPDLLPRLSRALYLDSDTFVAGPLRALWEMPLQGLPLAAVANVVEPMFRDHVASLGIAYPGGFFNSGVLLLDLDVMRAEDSAEALFRYARDHRRTLLWPDQDALNTVFEERWLSLHPRWNAQNSLWAWRQWALEVFDEVTLREATSDPGIRHFEGPSLAKPWHYLCRSPGYREYRAAWTRTAWADRPLDDCTLATRVIKLLPADKQLGTYKRLLRWRDERAR